MNPSLGEPESCNLDSSRMIMASNYKHDMRTAVPASLGEEAVPDDFAPLKTA